MGFQSGEILKAFSSKLLSDATLLTLTSEIYVLRKPKASGYPAIVIGEMAITSIPFNVFGRKGRETLVPIIIYDDKRTPATLDSIAKRIDALLDEVTLTIIGNSHVVTQVQEDELSYDLNNVEENSLTSIRLLYKVTTQEGS